MFCETASSAPPRHIPLKDDEDMFQKRHGAYYVNGYLTSREDFENLKEHLKRAWTGKLLEHYEEYVGPRMRSSNYHSLNDYKYFVNGMEVSSKDWVDLKKEMQEATGVVSLGKTMNFDYYMVLSDGSLSYIPTR